MWGKKAMEAKREFVRLVLSAEGQRLNLSELCRRFEVSRTSGYRLLDEWEREGEKAFEPRSKRPKNSPKRTDEDIEKAVLELRDRTHWGARKIAHVLKRDHEIVIARSTVNQVLKRNGRISDEASQAATPYCRFEHPQPNDLWQMDFMGWFQTGAGRCHSLTVLDDHSRYSLGLRACRDEQSETVQRELTAMFERHGLPWRMTMDRGAPWAGAVGWELTRLVAWMIRLGVAVSYSRPYHPQTQGKDERFHLTLQRELTNHVVFRTLADVQRAYDEFRERYNSVRPHEALGMEVPSSRYRVSSRSMPAKLPSIEYGSADVVRKVGQNGKISFRRHLVRVGRACVGLPVAIRPTERDGVFDVYFCAQQIRKFDLRELGSESAGA